MKQDSEEKVNKLIYNSKVHRWCSGKRFVVSEVMNLKGLCTVETSFTNCFLFYCPMKTEAILQFYNKYWQEKRWSQTDEFVISKCPETNGRNPGQVPPLKHTKHINTDRGEGGKEQWEREWVVVQHRRTQGPWQLWSFALSIHLIDVFFLLRSKICFFFLTSSLCCSLIFCYFILIYWTLHFFIEMSKKLRCKRQFSMQDVSEVSEELYT